ncbi:MAG: hypothetical protein Hyperionvirus4_43 [Hyperionvirus sp.]|uniref:Uncharacterized protein n=1 Tax=Hyperionvirus sp. TaxID=2487770 RepID=A0A3G5A7C5_9VIRU|nr:MAG: hypothetical protein Hyperionvirus4_43 [Hyperionvirus sp.]
MAPADCLSALNPRTGTEPIRLCARWAIRDNADRIAIIAANTHKFILWMFHRRRISIF